MNNRTLIILVCIAALLSAFLEATEKEPKQLEQLEEHQQANTYVGKWTHKSVIELDKMGE